MGVREDGEKVIQQLQEFYDLLNGAEERHTKLIDLVKEYEGITLDMLHELEAGSFQRTEGHRRARALRDVRLKRRTAKDTMMLFEPLKNFSKKNIPLKAELLRCISDMKAYLKEMDERFYIPRAQDKKSPISGQHFEIEEKDISEDLANVKKKRGR